MNRPAQCAPRFGRTLSGSLPWPLLMAWLIAHPVVASPILFTNQHLDLRIGYDASSQPPLQVILVDDESVPRQVHSPSNCVLVVAESAETSLLVDLPPLGDAGDPIWVLPASQDPGLLFLGLSAEGIPSTTFDGPLELVLLQATGPGHFFLWQADLSGLTFFANTRDGVDSGDAFDQPAGGHNHVNWGFTTSGVYCLTVQAVGRRLGESTNVLSAPATLTFHVMPLPASTPFQSWQEDQWPGVSDPGIVDPGSDPDHDGLLNLWEYTLGLDPREPDSTVEPAPELTLIDDLGVLRAAVQFIRASEATDVASRLHRATNLAGPWFPLDAVTTEEPMDDAHVRVVLRDPTPVFDNATAFYRLEILLNDSP